MLISLVVAIADNGVIGSAGGLPWHLPDDLKHFRALTLGKSVLMGRRTFESIGRPLPGRQNLVMSRTFRPAPMAELHVVATLGEAATCARAWNAGQRELCVIGGAQVYALALPYASRIHLTQVHAAIPGDVCFSGYQLHRPDGESITGWRESARVEHPSDERHAYPMSFVTLERMSAPSTV